VRDRPGQCAPKTSLSARVRPGGHKNMPFDFPIYRTALGRMGHENVTFALPVAGQPIVSYMGDAGLAGGCASWA